MMAYPILTTTTFLPLVGAVAILLFRGERLARWIALGTSLATFAVSAPLYCHFDKTSSALQFVETANWIPTWNIAYEVGVDGISLPFIFLAAMLTVLCVSVSWTAVRTRVPEFYAALLVAETAMIGLFAAANLFLFFIFWELMVVPVFLLIGVWGGPARVHAAVKFLLFTLSGSVLMLVAMIALYSEFGTLNFRELAASTLQPTLQAWLFVAFLAAFAVKVPMFPVHTWLPDAHTEAPTAGSVILAGILLKMGAYGFLRVSLPILPDAVQLFRTPMLALSAVAIVYGAYVTLAQTDIKRLIAFSSVSHMGFVTLGIFTLNRSGVEGAVLQMINHGIISAALFLCVGMIYERTHTREIKDYGGVAKLAPAYSTFLALFCLAAAGFPGLNSFVGEFLIVGGAFKTQVWLGGMAIWGVALGTTYLIWFYYRVVMGEVNPGLEGLKLELNAREIATLAPLAFLAVCLGLYPDCVLSYLRETVGALPGVTP
ncbi:MAG: NADH-quinone oxidoreductase subunit M [Planctomycetes bacterium]|nr:NADH-quinone oxidoreductase subunit M [Planctomycetota bacterium]